MADARVLDTEQQSLMLNVPIVCVAEAVRTCCAGLLCCYVVTLLHLAAAVFFFSRHSTLYNTNLISKRSKFNATSDGRKCSCGRISIGFVAVVIVVMTAVVRGLMRTVPDDILIVAAVMPLLFRLLLLAVLLLPQIGAEPA